VLNDFAPVSPLVTSPSFLFARRTIPANNLSELIAWLKTNPNRRLGVAGGQGQSGRRSLAACC
jgi:tripartite-type tricarboxylate transporter receptor subunit TctC